MRAVADILVSLELTPEARAELTEAIDLERRREVNRAWAESRRMFEGQRLAHAEALALAIAEVRGECEPLSAELASVTAELHRLRAELSAILDSDSPEIAVGAARLHHVAKSTPSPRRARLP